MISFATVTPTNPSEPLAPTMHPPMTTRKRLEGTLADWHPHPKDNKSLAPVVRDVVASDAPVVPDAVAPVAPVVRDAVAPVAPVIPDAVASDAPVVPDAVASDAPVVPDAVASDAPVVRDAVASDDIANRFFDSAPELDDTGASDGGRRAGPAARRDRFGRRSCAPALLDALRRRRRDRGGRHRPCRHRPHDDGSAMRALRILRARVRDRGVSLPVVAPEPAGRPPRIPACRLHTPARSSVTADPQPPGGRRSSTVPTRQLPPWQPAGLPHPAPPSSCPPRRLPRRPTGSAGRSTASRPEHAIRRRREERVLARPGARSGGAAAIEAGEQSVALDPGDADAWLVLGAAYQTARSLRGGAAMLHDMRRAGPAGSSRRVPRPAPVGGPSVPSGLHSDGSRAARLRLRRRNGRSRALPLAAGRCSDHSLRLWLDPCGSGAPCRR